MGSTTYYFLRLGNDLYLEDTRQRLGALLDTAVRIGGMRGKDVADAFVSSGLAEEFERQNPGFVAGKSGAENLIWMLERTGQQLEFDAAEQDATSPDYWVGYMLAYFQARTGCRYRHVFERMSYADLREMHAWCQDISENEYISTLARELSLRPNGSCLAALRRNAHLTQTALAGQVGVSMRAIQQYESGLKDINRAAVETVSRLSLVLGCAIEDLIEPRFERWA